MLPSCFEVTHPILIRLAPKSDPNRGDCLGNHRPAWLSLGLNFWLQSEEGDGPQAFAHRGPAERVRALSPSLSGSGGHLFNNLVLQCGERVGSRGQASVPAPSK